MQIAVDLSCFQAYVNCGVVTHDVTSSAIAYASCDLDVPVSLVKHSEAPLTGALGCVVGRVVASLRRAHGFDLRFGAPAKRLEGDTLRYVRRLPLVDGGTVEADLVVGPLSFMPNVEYASFSIQPHRPLASQLNRLVPQIGEKAKSPLLNTHRRFQ